MFLVSSVKAYLQRYRRLSQKADIECPAPDTIKDPLKRGKIKCSQSRNLLERLRDYEADALRFMNNTHVPCTNNQGERDICMSKVQQKVSCCIRSMEDAKIFCRISAYLSTYRKQDVGVGEALDCLFNGTWSDFILKTIAGAEWLRCAIIPHEPPFFLEGIKCATPKITNCRSTQCAQKINKMGSRWAILPKMVLLEKELLLMRYACRKRYCRCLVMPSIHRE